MEEPVLKTPSSSIPSLRENFFWIFLGSAFYMFCQFGILVILNKKGSSSLVGQFSLAMAISAPITLFFNLQLRQLLSTDAIGKYSLGDYFMLRTIASILNFLVIASIAFYRIEDPAEIRAVIIIVGLFKTLETCSEIPFGLLQRFECVRFIAYSQIAKGFLILISTLISVMIFQSLVLCVAALALQQLIVFCLLDLRAAQRVKDRALAEVSFKADRLLAHEWNMRRVLRLNLEALPLGFTAMFISLNINIPMYFLEQNLGLEILGIYTSLSYLIRSLQLISGSLGRAIAARLSTYYISGRVDLFFQLLAKMMLATIGIGLVGLVAAYFCSDFVLSLLFNDSYREYKSLFMLLLVNLVLVSMVVFLGNGLTAGRMLNAQPVIFGGAMVFCFVLSGWLVPRYGMMGAAYSACMTSLFQLFASAVGIFQVIRLAPKPG